MICQTTILEMCKKKDKNAVDKLLTQHVILNSLAFNVVQTLPFICFVQGVAAYGPVYMSYPLIQLFERS